MRAVYIKEFGGPENLEIREVTDPPSPRKNEVLVAVKAAGLNRADLLQRRGLYPAPEGFPQHIPGMEFSGNVIELGSETGDLKIGDRVFGIISGGAQAEKILIDHSHLAKVPDNLDLTEAGGIPEVFITAYDAIFTQGELKAGETLLVHAAGSGVGLAAIQLAKAAGADVIGTSRTEDKLKKGIEFGLSNFVVTGGDIFADKVRGFTNGRGVDVVLDLVGGSYLPEDLKCLAKLGRIMLVGLTGGRTAKLDLGTILAKRAKIIGTVLRSRSFEEKSAVTETFSQNVVPLFAKGTIKPNTDRIFPFDQISKAHEYLESNKSFGKVILEMESNKL